MVKAQYSSTNFFYLVHDLASQINPFQRHILPTATVQHSIETTIYLLTLFLFTGCRRHSWLLSRLPQSLDMLHGVLSPTEPLQYVDSHFSSITIHGYTSTISIFIIYSYIFHYLHQSSYHMWLQFTFFLLLSILIVVLSVSAFTIIFK